MTLTMSKKNRNQRNVVAPAPAVASADVEYRPSDQAEKYNIDTPKYAYKILAFRNDYVKLQEEVTRYINDGWSLAGGLATSVISDQYNVTTVFAQAVYKN